MQSQSYIRTLSNWLKKDETALEKGIKKGMDVYELAFELEREPMSILGYLTQNSFYECDAGGDEEREFYGVALSGVSLFESMLWSRAAPERSSDIDSLMKIGDMRVPLEWANEYGVAVAQAEGLEDLCWLIDQDDDKVRLAMLSIERRFDVITPYTLRRQVSGLERNLLKDEPFPPLTTFRYSGAPSTKQATTTYRRKSTTTSTVRRKTTSTSRARTSYGASSYYAKKATKKKYSSYAKF